MNNKRVLIVGAGGLGITCAYFLQKGGAEISFLVRPHRKEELSRPQTLYCYNDHSIKTLGNYHTLTSPDELQGQHYDFVLLTIDGATCRSEQGSNTLTSLGKHLAETDSNLVICSVGIGLLEHVQKTTGFPATRILQGSMRMFAYQPKMAQMPLPPPTNVELHNSADIAYLFFPSRIGFFIANKPNKPGKAFVQLWKDSGEITCQRMPTSVYAGFTNMFFCFTVAEEIDGWQGTDHLIGNTELWALNCEAQREILRMKQHGLLGKLFALLMSNKQVAKTMRDMARDGEPIGFTAFNKFHHGGKVLEQDVQVLQNCLSIGEQQGQKMPALKSLLKQWQRQSA